jgi:hypothetical protein
MRPTPENDARWALRCAEDERQNALAEEKSYRLRHKNAQRRVRDADARILAAKQKLIRLGVKI